MNLRLVALVTSLFVLYVHAKSQGENSYIGLLASGSSLVFCASPLATVSTVIRTKSTESLPFNFILSSFLVSCMWLYYGLLADIILVTIPNAVGALLAIIQLTLFVLYPSKPSKKVHSSVS